jgi:hypothetical protein
MNVDFIPEFARRFEKNQPVRLKADVAEKLGVTNNNFIIAHTWCTPYENSAIDIGRHCALYVIQEKVEIADDFELRSFKTHVYDDELEPIGE